MARCSGSPVRSPSFGVRLARVAVLLDIVVTLVAAGWEVDNQRLQRLDL